MSATTLSPAQRRLQDGPVLPVLLSLALPNALAMAATAAVGIAETAYVAVLGREALAAMALVFPFVMLMGMLSVGGMGGGIASAIARARGAGDATRAAALAWHAMVISAIAGLGFTLAFLLGGAALYRFLGARDAVLEQALQYSQLLFGGALVIWLANGFISVLRGLGDMRAPSVALLLISVAQVVLGASLGLGLGPLPRLGMRGVALGQVAAFLAAGVALYVYMRGLSRAGVFRWGPAPLARGHFWDILRVGLLACLSPLQTVAIVLVVTGLVARIGVDALAGYGIGARLEFMLIPIAFGVGVAAVPMVGMAVGRGDFARARRIAWTAAAVATGVLGAIGVAVALWPRLWTGLFRAEPAVLAYADEYLRWAGPGYAFFGTGLALFFAMQGAGRVLGPVLGTSLRLVIVIAGGSWLAARQAPSWTYFALIGAAMVVYGLFTAATLAASDWKPRSAR